MSLRQFAVTVVLSTAALVVAACGGQLPAAGTGTSGDNPAYPVTVETAFGEVTIDSEPQRVVALGWGDAETALALGVQPVGASDWLGFGGSGVGPWAEGRYDEPPEIIGTLEPEYEKIAKLRPDLILDVNSSGDQDRYDTLSKIAPVVGVPPGGKNYTTGWREQMTMIARALGEPDKGQGLIEEVEDRFAKTSAQYPQFNGKTIAIGARTSNGWGAYVESDIRVEFAEALGFTNSKAIQERAGDSFSIEISQERLDLLDADLTVVFPIYVKPSVVTEDPLFQQIPSVADGRFLVLGDGAASKAFSTGTTLALKYALDKVPPKFATALDE